MKISIGARNGWKCRKTRFYFFCLYTSLYWRFKLPRVPPRKNFSRSIDWYRKFFISCLLARYRKLEIHRHIMKISTGGRNGWKCRKTRFYVFCLFTPLYWRFRLSHALQTVDLEEIYRLVPKILNFMPCGSVLGRFSLSCKNFVAWASKIYRNSIEILSKFYRNSIEILSTFYRNANEIL